MKSLALVGINNSHPYVFGGFLNGAGHKKFTANSPQWTHTLFPAADWGPLCGDSWRFSTAWSRQPELAAQLAETVGISSLAADLNAASRETDGAFVCDMWGEYHLEQALLFLEQGKPVFVDKPLAECSSDARRMIQAALENDTVLSSCSSLRYDPSLVALKARLAGELGRPRIITVCCPCYQDLARYSVHGIEMLLELTGNVPVAALRNIGQGTRRHLLLLEFADGACGVIHSWEEHAYSITVTGENGQDFCAPGVENCFKPMIEAVLESFVSGVPVVPYREALEVVKVIEAGLASRAAGGARVELRSEESP